ncbi:MAG: hypothetical protein NWR45_05750 [Candidatus Nanopelagicales bacterium]|jgi:hypothetical protein|nr:hypothetical protein [Candidatus Nanopelagicales bacterium]
MSRIRSAFILSTSAILVLTLAACSSEGEAEPTPTLSAPSTPSVTDEASTAPITACETFFEVDLIRSQVAAGAGDLTKKEKRALLQEYKTAVDALVIDADQSFVAGALPERVLSNAERMQANLARVSPNSGIDGISKAQKKRLRLSAKRIERACVAAGVPIPQENLDARALL